MAMTAKASDYLSWFLASECCFEDSTPYLYQQAKGILYALKEKQIDVAIASRSPTPEIARTFLENLGIKSMFVAEVSQLGIVFSASSFSTFIYLFIASTLWCIRAFSHCNISGVLR